jgi:hypothetical protein
VTVTVAVVLQWLAALVAIGTALELISIAFELRHGDVETQIEGALVNQGIVDVSGDLVVTGVFVAGVLLLLLAFVRVMAAVYLARGRRWARVLVAILALIGLLSSVAFMFEGYWARALGGAVIEVLVLWLLFNGRASEFFASAPQSDD